MENACKGSSLRGNSEKKRIEAVLGGEEEEEEEKATESHGSDVAPFTCVMKFGGSSLASAERIREIAQLIVSFPDEKPVVVLSAMGKTTNNLLLVMNFSLLSD